MSFAVPPGCGSEMVAVGCAVRTNCCTGAVTAVAGCLDSRAGKLSVCAEGVGSATSDFGGNGFSALASSIARGSDASGAASAVAGSLVAAATGAGAVDGDGAVAVAGASCIRLAGAGSSPEPG